MSIAATLLALSEISGERERIDPKKQLAGMYQEVKYIYSTVMAGEKQLANMIRAQEERKVELAQILREEPLLEQEIANAKERMIRQRGMSLKDLLEIQQAVAKAEANQLLGEARAIDIQERCAGFAEEKARVEKQIKGLKNRYNELAACYNQEKARAELQMAALAIKEEGLLEELPPDVKALYLETLQYCPDSPVVVLEKEICTGCRIGLSKHMVKMVQQSAQPVRCENCRRILLSAESCRRGDI